MSEERARGMILKLHDLIAPEMDDDQATAFVRLLDINTPESLLGAAMLLVPEGWGFKVRRWTDGGGAAGIYPPEGADSWHQGTTPALALISAIRAARDAQ